MDHPNFTVGFIYVQGSFPKAQCIDFIFLFFLFHYISSCKNYYVKVREYFFGW